MEQVKKFNLNDSLSVCANCTNSGFKKDGVLAETHKCSVDGSTVSLLSYCNNYTRLRK
ncbi:MAG: hypothetical protein ACRCZB_04990 [Bacteroidales bacterium]